jgi:hypothetical protein
MVYLAVLKDVFKVLNLFLNEYVAEILLSGNGIRLLSIKQSSNMAHHLLFYFYHIMQL